MTGDKQTKQPFIQLRSHWHYMLVILLTCVLFFVFIPLFMLTPGQAKQFLNNGRELQVVVDVSLLIILFTLIIGALYGALSALKRAQLGAHIIMYIFFWVLLSGFLFSLTEASGMVDLRHEPTLARNCAIVVILSAILSGLYVSRYVKTMQVFVAVFLAISVLPSLPRVFSQFEKQQGHPTAVSLSPDNNLILVGLDGLPGHVVNDVLSARTATAQQFKDFTMYENVASTSPATDASLMGIMYGNHDFTKYESPVWADNRDLIFNQTDKINFTTSFKYNGFNTNGTKLSAGQFGKAEQRNELFDLYHNVSTRVGGAFGARFFYWVDAKFFPFRKGKFYTTVEGFDRLMDTITVDSDRPTAFFTHFTFTHWPTVLDENCIYREHDFAWMVAHQNIEGIKEGTICAITKYTELIAKFKKMGVYDNSTIVFLSDHGKPYQFYDTPPSNLKINDGKELGFDRYQPFLMIKPAGYSADTMSRSDRHVLLDDLAQTLCYNFAPSDKCDLLPGVNILDADDVPPDDFYIHVVKDRSSSWAVTHHKSVKLPRNVPLLDAMEASPEIDLTER